MVTGNKGETGNKARLQRAGGIYLARAYTNRTAVREYTQLPDNPSSNEDIYLATQRGAQFH
jgi:hypothetical protein